MELKLGNVTQATSQIKLNMLRECFSLPRELGVLSPEQLAPVLHWLIAAVTLDWVLINNFTKQLT